MVVSLKVTERRKSLLALILALGLTATVALPLAAEASTAKPDSDLEFVLGAAEGSYQHRSFGDLSTRRIPFGADTTRLVFATDLRAIGPVWCGVYSSDREDIASRTWSPGEWDLAADRVLDVPAGSTSPGDYPVASCSTSGPGVSYGDEWTLAAVAAAGPTVTLAADDSLITSSRRGSDHRDSTQPNAFPGERVVLTGPPGTWTGTMEPATARYGAYLALVGVPDKFDVEIPIDEVSADGSTISVTLPVELPAEYFGNSLAFLYIFYENLAQETPEFPGTSEAVSWSGTLDIADRRVSTTLTLNRTVTLPGLPIRATAVVDADATSGTVTFTVDEKTVRIVPLSTAVDGRVATTFPSLPRGTHVVRALYSGAGAVGASVSLPVTLRILG